MKFFKTVIFSAFFALFIFTVNPRNAVASEPYWQLQSIDTVKYSRDLAREKLTDESFEEVITLQVENIAKTGATHVAIGTPYDSEFIPFIKKWVTEARKNGLNVWFRGNFSGWEGWFGFESISREEHKKLVEKYILENSELFEDGDIFTSCTECENGGPGDPRDTGDISGYRNFLIDEYRVAERAFKTIGKDVSANYFSMNGDVAYLVMDKKTTENLDGVVVIDHYVDDSSELTADIERIKGRSGGNVILGEFGAPIPDIHGEMTEYEQALWLDNTLSELSKVEGLIGINYWTSFGGTTSIWRSDGIDNSAVSVLTGYFSPMELQGKVINELGRPIKNAMVLANSKIAKTDKTGIYTILTVPSVRELVVIASGYSEKLLNINKDSLETIILSKSNENLIFKLQKWLYNLFKS